ncbi:nucleoid-associated protein [Tissierella praeacuta]|uniref:nucleoid-associated protein n=1 Tax=Tissierella praeacuta TaxID=43131 RepID=UPI002FD92298
MEIKINGAILHILDSTTGLPVYSQENLGLEDEKVQEFIGKHIERIFNDQAVKSGKFVEDSAIKDLIRNINEDFIDTSISIAEKLYELMLRYLEIPSGDLLMASLNIETHSYLIIIKFNYKEGYTHYVDYGDSGTSNKIVVNKVMFPSETQKNIEAALINLGDLSLKIFEREYDIEGEKTLYFSKMFLGCDTDLSIKESIKVIREVAKDITKRYYDDDFNKVSEIKEAIYDNLDSGSIEVENVANAMFRNNPNIKKEYMERVEEAGVNKVVDLEGKKPEKKLTVHKIKMDNGIQLDIPVDIYRDRNIIEFVNNPDGTISIIIKNISKIKQGS